MKNKNVACLLLVTFAMQSVRAMEFNSIYIKNDSAESIKIDIFSLSYNTQKAARANDLVLTRVGSLEKNTLLREKEGEKEDEFAPKDIAITTFPLNNDLLHINITNQSTDITYEYWIYNAIGEIQLKWAGDQLLSSAESNQRYKIVKAKEHRNIKK